MLRLKKMSGVALKTNNPLFFPYIVFLFFIPFHFVFGDAYLASDRIYYSADTYSVDYEKKIITATGNAYYRKEQTEVKARKVVIHYAEEVKRAYFHDDVVLFDRETGREIRGAYAEAYYNDDYYFVRDNGSYRDGERVITSGLIESLGEGRYTFTDDVVYTDDNVRVDSAKLEVLSDDTANFTGDVRAESLEDGDEIFCDLIRYGIDTGDGHFQGDVLYIEHGENGLVLSAEVLKYFNTEDYFILLEDVQVLSGEYSMGGSFVKYYREKRLVESQGETVVFDGEKTIYSGSMQLYLDLNKLSFLGGVRGIIPEEERQDSRGSLDG